MRPAGEIKLALLRAAAELATPRRGPTLRELAAAARVGLDAAESTVENMVRAGDLVIVRKRKVEYRNKPVAEYSIKPDPSDPASTDSALGRVLASWVR
jgi:hypothetical protein